jgi:hypothetical protein
MRKIAVGRQMTEDAAAHGLKYALHNDLRDSAGMYLPEYNALLLSMVPYGMVSRSFVERNEEAVFNMFKDVIMSRVFHEHTHFYQHKIWNSGEAPAGVRSVDRALWYLAREAQADLNAHIAMRQYVGTQMMSGDEILSKFAFYVEKDNHDADYYSLRKKSATTAGYWMPRNLRTISGGWWAYHTTSCRAASGILMHYTA